MKIGIMQPYLFPYLGYFQLIAAVDKFIIYDDVNFIKQGWINRNNILLDGKPFLFTLDLRGASSFKKINEITRGNNGKKIIKTIYLAYSKAPFFDDIFPIIKAVFESEEKNLALFVSNSITKLVEYMGINTEILSSFSLVKNNSIQGKHKVLEICSIMGATHYINSIGGRNLYSKKEFELHNIILNFLSPKAIEYKQFNLDFVPSLSVIDVLMFNSKDNIKHLLKEYDLT